MTERILALLSRTEVWIGGLVLAAFLVLFWALRGAPIGQAVEGEGEEAPRAGYRDRVIAAMVLGLMLILAGAYVAVRRGVAWSMPIFAVGFGVVLTLIAVNRRHRHGSPTLRRTIELSNAALTAALLAGVLVVFNVLAFRYGGRALDLTRERMFSLSTLSLNQVKGLEKPVKFTVFFGQSSVAALEMGRVLELLELYKAANPSKITIETIDPYRDRERFALLAQRVPDVQVSEGGGVVIELGEGEGAERLVVPNTALFEFPRQDRFTQNSERFVSTFHGEDAVTSALARMREGKRPKIAFLTGHGEPSLDELDPRKPGLGLWRSRLSAMGAEVVPLNLLSDEVPRDVELVIAVTGKSPFKEEEVGKLRAYLAGGGPALLLVANPGPTGLDDLLKTYNVAVGPGVIVDPEWNYGRRLWLVSVRILGAIHHPIIDPLANSSILVPNGAPLHVLTPGPSGGSPVNPAFIATPILRTSARAWAETELSGRPTRDPGKDEAGPLTVGVAVTDRASPDQGKPEESPRLVVLSSVALADNQFLALEPADLDLLMNAAGWLRGRADAQGIAPKTHVDLALRADPVLRFRLIMVPSVMAVLVIVALGVTTYLARRE